MRTFDGNSSRFIILMAFFYCDPPAGSYRFAMGAVTLRGIGMKLSLLPAAGLVLGSTAALAQPEEGATPAEAPPAEAPPPEAAAPPPADGASAAEAPAAAAAAPAANVTPADIDTFAAVTIKLQAINADATLDAQKKQEAMRAAASEGGLDAAKYNAIARAAEADTDLREKILAAVAAKRGGAAPSSAQ